MDHPAGRRRHQATVNYSASRGLSANYLKVFGATRHSPNEVPPVSLVSPFALKRSASPASAKHDDSSLCEEPALNSDCRVNPRRALCTGVLT